MKDNCSLIWWIIISDKYFLSSSLHNTVTIKKNLFLITGTAELLVIFKAFIDNLYPNYEAPCAESMLT